jgi:hypothetical protein
MSPLGEEKQYKSGMRKDPDGFMDIEWCSSKVSCSIGCSVHTSQNACCSTSHLQQ